MKKIFISLCVLFSAIFALQSFALTDTDADGVADAQDQCPRVYSRSDTGCPKLAVVQNMLFDSCQKNVLSSGKILVILTPVCDKNSQSCMTLTGVSGVQMCDAIFPVIYNSSAVPIIRGPVYILGFTK